MLRAVLLLFTCFVLLSLGRTVDAAPLLQDQAYRILLRSRQFVPPHGVETAAQAQVQADSVPHHVLLQFDDIPSDAEKAAMAATGIHLLHYLPDHAWFAAIDSAGLSRLGQWPSLRWLGELQPTDKMPAGLAANRPASYALENGSVLLRVVYFEDVDESTARAAAARHGGVGVESQPTLRTMIVRMPSGQVRALAAEDAISWLSEAPPAPAPANDSIRARMHVNDVQAAPYNLSGDGVRVGIWDCTLVWPHTDFSGRLTLTANQSTSCTSDGGTQNHATHVAGILAGSGANSQAQGGTPNQWRGVAPGALLYSYDFYDSVSEVFTATNTYNIDIAQNSWSFLPSGQPCDSVFGNYTDLAPNYDQIVTGVFGKRISVVFAAGNQQGACGTWNSVTPPATAKDVIAVGATDSLDDSMTAFSSWGPTDDGRTKPDVVAPGYRDDFPGTDANCSLSATVSGIKSTCPNNGYGMDFGTSMSAPAVSGVLALLLQQYRLTSGQPLTNPLPSTLKALVIHGAVDLGNPGPDFKFGWGRVDAKNSVDLVRSGAFREGAVTNGQAVTIPLIMPSCGSALKVTLVWDDPEAMDNALVAYINDLDLTLVGPDGTTYYPWLLDPLNPANPATRGINNPNAADHRNNVEQVQVDNPAAGNWTLRVSGTNVPQGPQRFSLVSEALSGPVLSSISPPAAQPGTVVLLHGCQFANPYGPASVSVNLNGQAISVGAGNVTNNTITITVPMSATTGTVSVTTPVGTSNALPLAVVRPQLYFPMFANGFPPPFNWLDVSDGARVVNGDDVTQTLMLPFPFHFYGSTYTSVQVSSNGFISFSPLTDSFYSSSCIPSSALPNNAVYAFWADLFPGDPRPELAGYARAVWAKTVGNNFVIEWQQVPRRDLPDVETFEIVLGSDNSIILQYLSVSNTSDVVVGVEDATGSVAQQSYCSRTNPAPPFEIGNRPTSHQLLYFSTP